MIILIRRSAPDSRLDPHGIIWYYNIITLISRNIWCKCSTRQKTVFSSSVCIFLYKHISERMRRLHNAIDFHVGVMFLYFLLQVRSPPLFSLLYFSRRAFGILVDPSCVFGCVCFLFLFSVQLSLSNLQKWSMKLLNFFLSTQQWHPVASFASVPEHCF